uniref:DNA/RNA non-specific endonuclease/pyrophosphatase/phosphodiesterase domain-containing protein n=1 Tax=Trichogramma kaykai TaxID=54128 RepID=A0ABD2WS53_9HYME
MRQKCYSKFSTDCSIRKKRQSRNLENENDYLNERQQILHERILIRLIARKKAAQLQKESELEARERERVKLEREKEEKERERVRLEKEKEIKERERIRLEKEKENEEKERERIRLEKEKEEKERERVRLEKEKEVKKRERIRLEKEKEEKERERVRLEKEKEVKERERISLEKEKVAKERERFRLTKESEAKEQERLRLQKEKEEKEREGVRLEKEKEAKELEERLRLKKEETEQTERLELEKEKEAIERERLKLEEKNRAAETTTAYPIITISTTSEKNEDRSGLAVLIPLFGLVGGAFFFLKGTLPVLLFVVLPAITGLLVLPPPPPPGPPGANNNNQDPENDQDDENSEERSSEESKEKNKKRFSCKIDIRKVSDSYPIILMPSEPTKFMFPTRSSTIILQPGEKIAFGCHNVETYECKNKTLITKIGSTNEYSIDAMRCPIRLYPKVKSLPGKAYGYKKQYKKYQIGISYGLHFLPTIDVYFSIRTSSTLFVRILLSKALKNHQKIPPSQPLKKDICCKDDARPLNMYERLKQQETFDNLFSCHGNTASNESCSYISDKNNANMFLVPSQLASESDFIYTRAAMTSFYYLNTAPQWKSIKHGNWEKIENHVRKMATELKKDLVVLTGTHEQLELLDQEDSKFKWKGVFMWNDPQNCKKEIPVPLYFWKLVYDPSNNYGIVFVTVNNPYIKNGKNYHLCKGAGQIIDGQVPAGWEPLNVKQGYSYMCQIEDFILTTEIDLVDKLYA